MRAYDPNDPKPLLVELYMLAHRIRSSKQAGFGSRAEHADRSSAIFFLFAEESAIQQMKGSNRRVSGIYTIDGGRILLRFRDGLGRNEPFAGGGSGNVANIVADDPVVLKCKAG